MPPSKKPTLSLRQPPSANLIPDLDAAERFVRGESASAPSTPPLLRVAEPPAGPDGPEESGPPPVPTVQLVEVPSAEPVPSFRRATKSVVTRKRDGAVVRRTTIYFELELARQLAAHCVGEQKDVSEVVSEAVRAFLAKG